MTESLWFAIGAAVACAVLIAVARVRAYQHLKLHLNVALEY